MTRFTLEKTDGVATLTFDAPDEAVNTLNSAVGAELEPLLERLAADSEVEAVILISGKRDSFIAGADVEEFGKFETEEQAATMVRGGQQLVNRLASFGKPVVAAIHGSCLGGGLEVALVCDYRLATDHPKTTLGLPEVQLGVLPALGGCQRLPRLIGARAALDIILAGKTVHSSRALELGMVHEVVEPERLRERAFEVARHLIEGWRPPRPRSGLSRALLDDNPLGRWMVFNQAKKTLLSRTGGHYPAPLAALEVVEYGYRRGIEAGMEREAALFAKLATGDVSKNLVHIFFATTALRKDPGVEGEAPAARKVEKLGVVGAGFMGSAIAGVAVSRAEVAACLKDTTKEQVDKGLEAARAPLRYRKRRGRIDDPEYQRLSGLLSGSVEWQGFDEVDLVIEAVFEDVHVKHEVLREIEARVSDDCIIASNTSTIPITRLAEVATKRERIVGMHFFSPVERMPLLEVITTTETAPWVTVTAVDFGRAMGKTVIVVRDRPGFWVNRILAPYMNEAGHLLAEGHPVESIDKAAKRFGFPVGPLQLMDEVGLDVALKASAVMHEAFGDRLRPVDGLARMTEGGYLGRKNGRGFYLYEDGKRTGIDPAALELVGAVTAEEVRSEDLALRLVCPLLNEAARALEEEVVRSPRDGDIGAIFGIGFPPFLGGPFRYVDSVGAKKVVGSLERLRAECGERFEPSPLLLQMASENRRFYD